MSCPFVGPKMFWAGPIFCAGPKIYLHIVAVTNILALNAVKFLGWLKKLGPAQNILGPVKGQGIRNIVSKHLCF